MSASLQTVPVFESTEAPHPQGLGGLLALVGGAERPMPLREVKVRATLLGDCARVVVEQRFSNPYAELLEVVHLFPVNLEVAVVEMQLCCGDLVVDAECREKKEAQAVFEAARQQGHSAGLLVHNRDDVHTLRVTNLPPGQEVRVRLVLAQRLKRVDGRFEFRFPTTIAPRYTPGTPVGHEGPGVNPDTDHVPDASSISPPLRLSGGTRLDLELEIPGAVSSLESSLHALRLDLAGGGMRVAPSALSTLNKDFVLRYSGAGAEAAARAWTDGRFSMVVVEPPTALGAPAMPRDAVFVIDISGSMGGAKIDAARRALLAAMHGLMPGDRFKLIAFDDRVEQLSSEFLDYGDASLARADRWIHALHDRGGTEMAAPLKAALDGATPAGRLRTVLFITDGQASNEAELLTLVSARLNGARLFTLGIDTAVSAGLLEKLAQTGGGTCELATPNDDIEAVVARLEARFGSPILTELRVDGLSGAWPMEQVVFSGRAASLLVEGAPASLTVTGRWAQGSWSAQVQPQPSPFPLGVLWARERVQYLEHRLVLKPFEEDAVLPEIRRVALEHKILSRCTAFVAVETRQTASGPRREVVQSHELPEAWQDPARDMLSRRAPRGGAVMASMAGAPMPPPPPLMAPAPGMAPPPRPAPKKLARLQEEDAEPMMDLMDKEVASAPPKLEQGRARSQRASAAPTIAPDARLASAQSADGSFGGDVDRTVVALLVLLLLGNTRRGGLRQRTVLKAATWLAQRRDQGHAALALQLLEQAEAGQKPQPQAEWRSFAQGSEEAALLAGLMP